MTVMINIFKRRKTPKPISNVQPKPVVTRSLKDDNGTLIQIESGWPDDEYELFLGETIQRLRRLMGGLTFNPQGQEQLIQSTLTTALLAGRLTDNKVLDCLVDGGGDRIRSGKIQKSITVLATIVCYVAEQLAKVDITCDGKNKWMCMEPFENYINNSQYEVSHKEAGRVAVMELRAKLTNLLISQQTIQHLDECGENYSNVLFNLVTVRDFQPLSGSIIDAINRNRIGQLSPTKEKKKKKGDKKAQLVELISQVIKNGRANQPGSKVWSSETSVYFLFPQAANDIRALAKTYKVETPKDTLDLVKLLADKSLIDVPENPINPKLPYYKKISITAQGVPKKPQVAIELSAELRLHDNMTLDNVEIEEVVGDAGTKKEENPKQNVVNPEPKPTENKAVDQPDISRVEQPIEKLIARITKDNPERIKQDVVEVTLGDIKTISDDPMKYINGLVQKGVASDFIINPKEPNKSKLKINIEELDA